MIGRYRIVNCDLYDIASRLREIDPSYFLVYSYEQHRYEVHSNNQRGSTFCLAVPYEELDERTIRLVRRSRIERMQEYVEELEAENNLDWDNERRRTVKNIERNVEQALSEVGR